ncbi:unnamed protein product [Fusarium equiseti]|uniref:AAA+ ATPase domain-containing protein n=1 Tax=Fusarium equiseti TaxID=61235 RepID=A0A8J2IF46_FUSEQ|nr:unnamed protein product [Fusarium equiseti]
MVVEEMATRLRKLRRSGAKPDDLLLTQEDLIGPEPSAALAKSNAYRDLNSMIGLKEVKGALKVLIDTLKTNYHRELEEKPLVEFSLNKVFLGSPGTGKTTVAKLYGLVLKDLGLLSNGELIVKNPADFVGPHIGGSEAQTKAILASTVGKVLVIEEAYGLFSGRSDGSGMNQFKTAVIDTIVGEVQSVPGEDRCVLLLGYKDKVEEMFQNVNPGLARRFPIASAFVFEDFDQVEMAKILDMKLGKSGFKATERGKSVALEVLNRARNRPNFGNAGEIDILLGRAQASHQQRVSSGRIKRHGTLEAIDFDEDHDRAEKGTDVAKLFAGDIGRDHLVSILEGYQKRVREAKQLEVDPEIPFNFLFRGPPGTGKTTAARKMGKVYYDMGFLASTEVIEVSATDLIGQYVGHTGPKVQKLLEKAMGRVLFIDEAYRLAPTKHGSFAQEAIDELVDCVTKPKYQDKLIIILAGYVQDINNLLGINPGLSSRFPESIDFDHFTVASCIHLLTTQLQAKKDKIKDKKFVDVSCLEILAPTFLQELTDKFETLSHQEGWANARDVKELAKKMYHKLDLSPPTLTLTEDIVLSTIGEMISERSDRMNNKKAKTATKLPKVPVMTPTPTMSTSKSNSSLNPKSTNGDDQGKQADEECDINEGSDLRDVGVSDEVWEQLQKDKKKEAQDKQDLERLKKAQKDASDADRERLVRQILAAEDKRKKIEEAKEKLKKMGVCPVGYHWIKQSGGYRCAGGSHWMTDEQVNNM